MGSNKFNRHDGNKINLKGNQYNPIMDKINNKAIKAIKTKNILNINV